MIDLRDKKLKASVWVVFLGPDAEKHLRTDYGDEKFEQICKEALNFVWQTKIPSKTNDGWKAFILNFFSRYKVEDYSFKSAELRRLERAYPKRYTEEHCRLIEQYLDGLTSNECSRLVTECIAKQRWGPEPIYFREEALALKRLRDTPERKELVVADPRASEYLSKKLLPKVNKKHGLNLTSLSEALRHWRAFLNE